MTSDSVSQHLPAAALDSPTLPLAASSSAIHLTADAAASTALPADLWTPDVNRKLWIGNIAYQTSERALRHCLGQLGKLSYCVIVYHPNDGRSRGFGFAVFEQDAAAESALGLKVVLDGRQLIMRRALQRGGGSGDPRQRDWDRHPDFSTFRPQRTYVPCVDDRPGASVVSRPAEPPSVPDRKRDPHQDGVRLGGARALGAGSLGGDCHLPVRAAGGHGQVFLARGAGSATPVVAGKLFVGGLAPVVGPDDLRAYFSDFGVVTDTVVIADRLTGQPRGFGFCTFHDPDTVDRIMAQGRLHLLKGKPVECKRVIPRIALMATRASDHGRPSPGDRKQRFAREDGYGSMMNRRIPFAGRRLKSHGHRSMMDVWIPYGGQQVKYVGARDDHRQHHQPYVGRFDPPPRGPWSSPVDMMGHYEYPCPTGGADRGGWAGQRPSLVTTYHPSGSLSLYPPSMTRHGPNMATSGYTAVVAHCAPTAPPQGFYAPLLPSYASMVPLMAPLPTPAVAAAGVTTGVPPASLVEHQRPRLQQQQAARGRVADPQRQDAILHGRGT